MARKPPMKLRCGARARTTGKPCKNWAMPNGRCRMHGGKSPGGIASPSFKHGRYSKYLPGRFIERYAEAAQDKDLLSLRDDIALMDVRLVDLLLQLHTGESGQLWQEVIEAKRRLDHAILISDADAVRGALASLDKLLESGVNDHAAWREIVDLLERKRRLSDSEHRRQIQNGELVPIEDVFAFADALILAVKRHVNDLDMLGAINEDLFVYFGDMLDAGYLPRSVNMSDAMDDS